MFVYHMRLAWLSFRKTPLLSSLIVGAIGLGIGFGVGYNQRDGDVGHGQGV